MNQWNVTLAQLCNLVLTAANVGAVTQSVSLVFARRVPPKVIDVTILTIAVVVTSLHTGRPNPDERFQYELVERSADGTTILSQWHHVVSTLPFHRLKLMPSVVKQVT